MATLQLFHLHLHRESTPKERRVENITLWVLQWTLALTLLASACIKLFFKPDELHAVMPWTAAVSPWFITFIATMEITGAVGLVVPAWLRVIPALTPWAACAVAGMQLLALAYHLGRGEFIMIPVNLSVAIASVVIAWGRFNHLPISAVKQPVSEHIRDPGAIPRGMA